MTLSGTGVTSGTKIIAGLAFTGTFTGSTTQVVMSETLTVAGAVGSGDSDLYTTPTERTHSTLGTFPSASSPRTPASARCRGFRAFDTLQKEHDTMITALLSAAALAASLDPSAGLMDARHAFAFGGRLFDQQNADQPYSILTGAGPDGTPLVRFELRHPWEQTSFDKATGPKQRSELAGHDLISPGQTIHVHLRFKVDMSRPTASPWGVITPMQLHQQDHIAGDFTNAPPFATYLLAEKDGSTTFVVEANATTDPTKQDTYRQLARVHNFDLTSAHELEVTVTPDSANGHVVAKLDGATLCDWRGPVGIGTRSVYPKFGWYDGSDTQDRAVSIWDAQVTPHP